MITFLAIPEHPRHVSTVQGYPTPLRSHSWSPPGCPCYTVCIAKHGTWTPAIQIRKIQEVQFIQRFRPKNGPFSQYTDVLWIYDQCCGSTPILISSLPCRFTACLIQILPNPSHATANPNPGNPAPAVGAVLGRIFDPNLHAVFFADLLDIFALSWCENAGAQGVSGWDN